MMGLSGTKRLEYADINASLWWSRRCSSGLGCRLGWSTQVTGVFQGWRRECCCEYEPVVPKGHFGQRLQRREKNTVREAQRGGRQANEQFYCVPFVHPCSGVFLMVPWIQCRYFETRV